MKAMVYHNYGSPDVLEFTEVQRPTVKDDEVLIKVHATAVTPFDWHLLTGTPFLARLFAGGLLKPKHKVLGAEVAGRVEAVGKNVKKFQPGDEVLGMGANGGGFAEYVRVSEDKVWPKPANMSFEEAAAVHFSASTALIGLCELGQLKSGQKVLINGASGGVGTLAVPIAKGFGAEVTGVCSTKNLDLVRSIGADHVIDYAQEDFAQNKGNYDLIFDVAGKRSFSDCKRALTAQGIYVTTEISPALILQQQWVSMTSKQKMMPMPPTGPDKDTQHLFEELLEAGKLTPIIDSCYPLPEVAEAFRYYEKGHPAGRVVITV